MSIELILQEELDEDEIIPFDRVVIYKRVDATSYTELADLPIGTTSYTDSAGVINDEYHTIFKDSVNGISSLPSHIYRALNPYKQRNEEDPPVAVILELETTSTVPTVDYVAIYKRKPLEASATRIALVAIGQQYYQDADGEPGDIYHSTFVDTTNNSESQPSSYVIADANSGLVVVSGRFENPAGDIYIRPDRPANDDEYDIEISLVTPYSSSTRTPTAQGQVIGITTKKVLTDSTTGFWSVTLIPNNLIEPNNTYYQFMFRGHAYYKYVYSTNGDAQNFAMLADVQPRYTNL